MVQLLHYLDFFVNLIQGVFTLNLIRINYFYRNRRFALIILSEVHST